MAGPRITDQMMYELPRWLKLLAAGFVKSVSAGFGILVTGTATDPIVSIDPAVVATAYRNYVASAAQLGTGLYAVYLLANGKVDVPDQTQGTQDLVFGVAPGPWALGASIAVIPNGGKLAQAPASTGRLYAKRDGSLVLYAGLTVGDIATPVGRGATASVEVVIGEPFQVT